MNETALASAGSDELFRKTLAFCGYTGYTYTLRKQERHPAVVMNCKYRQLYREYECY